VIAAGSSPNNLVLFDLSGPRKIGVLVAGLPRCADGQPEPAGTTGCVRMYWSRGSLDSWFKRGSGPVRVIWVSDDFQWFGPRPVCDPARPECMSSPIGPLDLNALTSFDRYLIEAGVTIFPLVVPGPGNATPKDKRRNLESAEHMGEYTGGFAVEGGTLGDGNALAHALRVTGRGYVLRLSAPPEEHISKLLKIRIKGPPHIRCERPFMVSAKGTVPIAGPSGEVPFPVVFPCATLSVENACRDGEGAENLAITAQPAPPPLATGKLHVVVSYKGETGFHQRFEFDRWPSDGNGSPPRVCVPVARRRASIRRITAYEESTGWAAMTEFE